MKHKTTFLIFVISIIAIFLSGCANLYRQYHSYLTLYNLKDARHFEVRLTDIKYNTGEIMRVWNDTLNVKGNFYISYHNRIPFVHPHMPALSPRQLVSKCIGTGEHDPTYDEQEDMLRQNFPEVYGFGKEIPVAPVGNASMIVDGKIVEVVLYQLNRATLSGSGIGKDNEGNLYRVYLSTRTYR